MQTNTKKQTTNKEQTKNQEQAADQKRYYSPQFTALAAVSVRRLAWAMGVSMPAAVDIMARLMPSVVDPAKVCLACQDNSKCQVCSFRTKLTPQEQGELLAAL